jgi:hypothetical protein
MLSIGLSNQIAEVPNPSKYSNLYMNRLGYCNHLVHVIRYQGMKQKRQISLITHCVNVGFKLVNSDIVHDLADMRLFIIVERFIEGSVWVENRLWEVDVLFDVGRGIRTKDDSPDEVVRFVEYFSSLKDIYLKQLFAQMCNL